jgi:hypothetical protein
MPPRKRGEESLATGGLGEAERSGLGCAGARVVVRVGGAVCFLSRGEDSGIRNGDVGPTVASPGIVRLRGSGYIMATLDKKIKGHTGREEAEQTPPKDPCDP